MVYLFSLHQIVLKILVSPSDSVFEFGLVSRRYSAWPVGTICTVGTAGFSAHRVERGETADATLRVIPLANTVKNESS